VEEIRAMPGYQFIPEKLLEEKELRRKNYWEKKNIDAGLRAKWLRLRASLTKQLNDAGVPLMCGSDSPEWYLVQGFAVHDELQNLIECGLSNYDALKTATVNPATYLGILIRTGTIESGKEADMILLEGNPLDDIRNTRKIISVFSNGKMYDKKQIGELLKK
jgi:imidazolonepropionase-like amidohydrolase